MIKFINRLLIKHTKTIVHNIPVNCTECNKCEVACNHCGKQAEVTLVLIKKPFRPIEMYVNEGL